MHLNLFKKISTIALLILLLFNTLLARSLTTREKKAARTTWLQGFEFYERAESSYRNNQLRESLTLFNASLTQFDTIKAKYPQWNPALIKFRTKLCKDKIKTIKNSFAKKNIIITESETDKENLLLKTRLAGIEKELKNTKKQLTRTYTSLEAARKEAARSMESSGKVEELMTEKIKIINRCALLEERNKELNKLVDKSTSNIDQATFDKALLNIETLKKDREKFISYIELEKEKQTLLIQKNNKLKFDINEIKKSATLNISNDKNFNAKILTLQNSLKDLQSKIVDKEDILEANQEKLKNANKSILKLRNQVEDARTNSNLNADAITKQLSNDNELLLKSLENANIKLIEKSKLNKKLQESIKLEEKEILTLKNTLATIDKKYSKTISDLSMLNKKVFITDTITKKQDQTIIDQKKEFEKLKIDFDTISKKYNKSQKREGDFSELAKKLISTEGKNQTFATKIKNLESEKEKVLNFYKESETQLIKIENKLKKSIQHNAIVKEDNLKLKVKLGNHLAKSKDEKQNLEKQVTKTLKINSDINKKIAMLTDELISLNSTIVQKSEKVKELQKKLTTYINNESVINIPPEPQIITKNPKFISLKRENNKLLSALNEKDIELRKLKNKRIIPIIPATSSDKEIQGLLNSADLAEANGKSEAAIWYYEKVLKKSNNNPTALSKLGIILATNGNDDSAIPLLNKALNQSPDDVDILLALTFCYIRKELYFDALGVASKASSKNPKDPTIQRYLGIICSYLEWNEAAESQFRKSFKLDPTSSETAYNAAVHIAKIDSKRKEEARTWYKRAIQLGAERDPILEKLIK